jgi:hypothetical protein
MRLVLSKGRTKRHRLPHDIDRPAAACNPPDPQVHALHSRVDPIEICRARGIEGRNCDLISAGCELGSEAGEHALGPSRAGK